MEVAVRHSFVTWQVPSEVISVFFSYSSFLSIIHSPYLYFQWPHRQIHRSQWFHFLLHNGIGHHFPRSCWDWNKCIDLNEWVIATKMPYRLNKHIFANSIIVKVLYKSIRQIRFFGLFVACTFIYFIKKNPFNSRYLSNILHTLRGCNDEW